VRYRRVAHALHDAGELPVHLETILDLITGWETAARQSANRLGEQIATLNGDTRVDTEVADLAITRSTRRILAAAEFTADDSTACRAGTRTSDAWVHSGVRR
jgi:hypothetical protein